MTGSYEDAFICHDCLKILFSPRDISEHMQETGHMTAAEIRIDGVVDAGNRRIVLFELPDEQLKLQR
jgi:hypothetical protein